MVSHFENTSEDHLLLELIRNNDQLAFRKLFDKYFVALCRYSATFVHDAGISEEVVLDVLTNLWNRRREMDITVSARLYLFRSVRNRSLNHLRDTKQNDKIDDYQDTIYIKRTEHDSLEFEDLDLFIQEAILSLPPKCRDIFVASRLDGKSRKEIARDMNISVKTVETQIGRAVSRIKELLKEFDLTVL